MRILAAVTMLALAPAAARADGGVIAASIVGGAAIGGIIAGAASGAPVVRAPAAVAVAPVAVDTVVIDRSRTLYGNRYVQFYGGYGIPGGPILAYGPDIDLYWYPAYREHVVFAAPVPATVERCYRARIEVRGMRRWMRICE